MTTAQPNREDRDNCGATPIRVVVEGRALCDEHRAEWLGEEVHGKDRIQRAMDVLDRILDEDSTGDWEDYLRRIAVAVLEAAA